MQVDESLSSLESLEQYGRSPILEQCLAYLGGAGAAAASSSAEDISRVILPLLAESVHSEEAVVCVAALQQLPAVGAAPCAALARLLPDCTGASELAAAALLSCESCGGQTASSAISQAQLG